MWSFFPKFALVSMALMVGRTAAGPDTGPEDPDFVPNDGELESDLAPLKKPQGNYHIVEEQGVFILNRETFAHFVMAKNITLVEFYAPWCGHCKKLEPVYAEAAKRLQAHGIQIAKVDGTIDKSLAAEYMVQGFPTLMLFKDGNKVEDYSGPRTTNSIVDYMLTMNDPEWKPPPSAVIPLVSENFTAFIKDSKLTLVMFYAPWCKHCKQVMPEYEGAAVELQAWGVNLAKVDGTREKELADQYKIEGWPAFKMFRKGHIFDYKDGPREKDNIITYMKEQALPPSEEKATAAGIQSNLDRLEVTVVGCFSSKDSDLFDEYMVAANNMRGTFKFMHTFSEEAMKGVKVPKESVAVFVPEVLSSPYENRTHVLTKKSATYREIIGFVSSHSMPLVGWRTKKNLFKYSSRPLVVVYYDVNYNHQFISDTEFIRNKVIEVAKNYINSNLRFAISSEEEFENEIKGLGFEDSGADVNVGAFSNKQRFRMEPTDDDFSSEDLAKFIDSLKRGLIQPHMKSLPIPATQDGLVKKIVAHSYDNEVHKVKKDAVIYFYAPWCGHCKKLDPVFKKVAEKLSETNENIIFAKMDATVNDIPYMFPDLKGYPSLFFVSAFEKFDPVEYQGDKDFKSLRDWINRHTSIFLSEEERQGQSLEGDEEIESFTSESFDDDEANEGDDGEAAAPGADEEDNKGSDKETQAKDEL